MNQSSYAIRFLRPGSVFYYISNTLSRNKLRESYSNYVHYANRSSRLLVRESSESLFQLSRLHKVNRFPCYLSSYKFHQHNIFYQDHKNPGYNNNNNERDRTTKAEPLTKEDDDDFAKLSLVKKFKLMYKRYWYVLIPVHVATSIVWYGSFFFAAKSGIDIVPLLEKMGATEKVLSLLRHSDAGYYGIAYAMYKIATPARYTITLGGTTLSINYLMMRGYIKPVPTKEELKVMYVDTKEEFKEKKDEMKEKYQEKKEEFIEKYQDKTEEMKEKYQERKSEFLEKYKIKSKSDSESGR